MIISLFKDVIPLQRLFNNTWDEKNIINIEQ
jgi:hypothetical protein